MGQGLQSFLSSFWFASSMYVETCKFRIEVPTKHVHIITSFADENEGGWVEGRGVVGGFPIALLLRSATDIAQR